MPKAKEPITLAEQAKHYRRLQKKSLMRQEKLAHIWNTQGGTKYRDELHAEQKFCARMIREAELHEKIISLIKNK